MDDIKFTTGLTTAQGARVAFRGTPFVERTAPLNQNALWMRWDRNMVVDAYSDMVAELSAIRTAVAMGDMSPLSKYVIAGPDAEAMMDRLIPRDIRKLQVGQIYYAPWCDENGYVVGDGLVFRMDENTFRVSADPGFTWWRQHAEGLDLQVTDITDTYGILTLQGPRSREVLEAATEAGFQELPFSRLAVVTIAGRQVEILRQGFTGEHGYELWVKAEDGPTVWDAVEAAGRPFSIRPAGAWALDVARLEAGLLIVGYDYTSAGPDHGGAGIQASGKFRASPFDLGLGRLVDFKKSDFIGRTALERLSKYGQHRQLVGLEIDWKQIAGTGLESEEPGNLRRVRWYPVPVFGGSVEIGHASSVAWSPTLRKLIGFGHLQQAFGEIGTQVTLRWEDDGTTRDVAARVVALPFHSLRRTASN
ncbi:aminomethyltransferase family protein [Sinorhizobium meliloti]|uniref:Aminomethyltransferase n=2 Tax=Rhizobium meliloti TaxID=382 RepID=Q92XS3_RHIME|nr:aminomethyltransferase family protein [Sinorhizobium meliloti]TWA88474.1 aminomethyltransferase [Ensifer sp. SEMIA 134]TWB26543.1 aminomethyltransferase [Ensifer sp. SEMIA 135]AAK65826.1 aminomethyltransferase [Sinorhizobium meliloti 1021]AGG70868.1 aminomethyltransferase [Sinorhizobium meliloti 2011]ASP61021.1 glycine cleavage system protein T [Sinorhizobium meliloti]